MQTSFPLKPFLSEYSQQPASTTVHAIADEHSQQLSTPTETSSSIPSYPKSYYKNNFEGEEIIGKGGFGTVFKVTHKFDDQVYAIKRLLIKKPFSENLKKSLMEVSTMIKFNHPGIVSYKNCWVEEFDYEESDKTQSDNKGSDDKELTETAKTASSPKEDFDWQDSSCVKRPILFIQLEFCRGQTLGTYLLSQTQDPIAKKLKIFAQIVLAVQTIHSEGIVHRDLKPDNIFFESETRVNVKIGDFGLATNYADRLKSQKDSNPLIQQIEAETLTTRDGTRRYMSPELKDPEAAYDMKADIYSLGIILYEMLHGYNSNCERIKILDDLIENRKFSKDFLKDYEEESKIILRMIDPNPASRPSAPKLAKEINQRKKYYESQRHNKGKAIIIGENGKESMTSDPMKPIFVEKSNQSEDFPFLKV